VQEMKDSVAFAKKEFISSNAQYFDLTLSKVRKSTFRQEISPAPNKENLQVKDVRSTTALRRKIKEISDAEELRPKNCDCSCFTIQPVDAASKSSTKEVASARILPAAKDSLTKVSASVKDSVSTKNSLKVEPKKQSTTSTTKSAKKPTSTTKKNTTTPKKKKPVYKGRVAKK